MKTSTLVFREMSHYIYSQKSFHNKMIVWMLFAWEVISHFGAFIQYCANFCFVNYNVIGLKNDQMISTDSSHLLSFWDLRLEISSLFWSRVKLWIRGINHAILRLEASAIFCNSFPWIKFDLFNRILKLNIFFGILKWIRFSITSAINVFLSTILFKSCWYETIGITSNNDMAHRVQGVELL